MNLFFGCSLGGAGPHLLSFGPGSSIEERCPVKALVAGASPVQDP